MLWRSVAILSMVLFLPSCDGGAGAVGAIGAGLFQRAPEKIAVAKGSVTIAGPSGFCVDKSATRDGAGGVFVLLGSCASIANSTQHPSPRVPAVLTASVSGPGDAQISNSLTQLEAFFQSPAGRGALARNGDPSSVEILSTRDEKGMYILRASDSSPNNPDGLEQEYWRALFDVGGRIITLSVIAFNDKPMSDEEGLAILQAFAKRIQRENTL